LEKHFSGGLTSDRWNSEILWHLSCKLPF